VDGGRGWWRHGGARQGGARARCIRPFALPRPLLLPVCQWTLRPTGTRSGPSCVTHKPTSIPRFHSHARATVALSRSHRRAAEQGMREARRAPERRTGRSLTRAVLLCHSGRSGSRDDFAPVHRDERKRKSTGCDGTSRLVRRVRRESGVGVTGRRAGAEDRSRAATRTRSAGPGVAGPRPLSRGGTCTRVPIEWIAPCSPYERSSGGCGQYGWYHGRNSRPSIGREFFVARVVEPCHGHAGTASSATV
jgi:hypothetical protein